jgi:FkbM family methyltransferase
MLNVLKQALLQRLRSAALKRHHHLIADWKLHNYPLAQHLGRLFALYQIDCVLDVGANLGQYHDLLREDAGFEGWIISFEPVQKYVNHLRRRSAADPHWIIIDYALGASHGAAEIHVTQSPGLSSFLTPSSKALPSFWEGELVNNEPVRIARLDDLLPALRSETGCRSLYLKLDTQGFDLEVIKGARDSLDHVRALQIEASIRAIYEGMPNWRESLEMLERQGFELSGMFPVHHDRSMRLIEFDCVMVNSAFLPA